MALKKRDWLFAAVVVAVFGTFFAISGNVKTSKVPMDEIHERFHSIVQVEGKKETERYCKECHDTAEAPLPEEHPPAFRCLFCHKTVAPRQ